MRYCIWIVLLAAPVFGAPAGSSYSEAAGASERRLFSLCARTPVDVDMILADPTLRKDLAIVPFGESEDIIYYVSCRAMAGEGGGCKILDGVGGGFSSDGCRRAEARARMAFFTARGGDAAGICRDMLVKDGRPAPAAERGCAAIIAAVRAGNSKEACEALKREKMLGPKDSCQTALAVWFGHPEGCADIKDAPAKRSCTEAAALAEGLRDARRCAASPTCVALESKSAAACEPLRRSFSASLCARARKAKPVLSQYKKGQATQRMSKEVQEAMKRLEKGLPPKPAPAKGDSDVPSEEP